MSEIVQDQQQSSQQSQSSSGRSQEQGKSGTETKYSVFMIHSSWSLDSISEFIANHGDEDKIGYMRVRYDRERRPTNQTIALLHESVYTSLAEAGYDRHNFGTDFSVKRLYLTQGNYPGEGRSSTLFIPIPRDLGMTEREIQDKVHSKLTMMSDWGILPAKCWNVRTPLKSRETGESSGGCFVSWKKDVEPEAIAVAKLVLDDGYWEEDIDAFFRCFWARERPPREEPAERERPKRESLKSAPRATQGGKRRSQKTE